MLLSVHLLGFEYKAEQKIVLLEPGVLDLDLDLDQPISVMTASNSFWFNPVLLKQKSFFFPLFEDNEFPGLVRRFIQLLFFI